MIELKVPIISQDDLQQFHARTLGSLISLPSQCEGQAPSTGIPLVDDDLEYYPDGSKRTLTQDQVAIFRHSEIQSLLRARRLELENHESGRIERPTSKRSERGLQPKDEPREYQHLLDDQDEEVAPEEEEYLRFLDAEREEFALAASARRNRGRLEPDGRKISTRRKVRELDVMTKVEQLLDYDDDPASHHASTQFSDPEMLPIVLRKFHWPTIRITSSSKPEEQPSTGV